MRGNPYEGKSGVGDAHARIAWDLGYVAGEAEGRRLERRYWAKWLRSFKAFVTRDEIDAKLAARSKRGRRKG